MFKLKKFDIKILLACMSAFLFSLDLGILLGCYFLSYMLLIKGKINPIKFYLLTWLSIIEMYFFGPIKYDLVIDSSGAFIYLVISFLAFLLGYLLTSLRPSRSGVSNGDLFPKYFFPLAIIGVCISLVGGYQGVNLDRIDLADIRSNLFNNVTISAQIGSVVFAFFIFLLIEFLHSKKDNYPLLTRVIIISGLVTPLFTAGRQLYLYFFLIWLATILYKKDYLKNNSNLFSIDKIMFLKIAAITSLILISLISILRFNEVSEESHGSKLEMFERYSSVQIRPSYKLIYDKLPVAVQGLVIEGSYYFGSQIGRFSELYGLNNFEVINFNAISKFPFLDRNLNKIAVIFGFKNKENEFQLNNGNINSFTWSTAVSGNILYFGTLGALIVNFIFGFICKASFEAYKKFPESIYAHNFIVANTLIIFYGIIASPLMDTFFLFYYIISIFVFFNYIKFLSRVQHV